jgi:hypothetical protein
MTQELTEKLILSGWRKPQLNQPENLKRKMPMKPQIDLWCGHKGGFDH